MKRFLNASFILLFSFNISVANEIKLEDYYKVFETFSGDIDKKETFHLIIARNKQSKTYDIIPITYFRDSLIRLESISFKRRPSIKSYHSKNNKITLLISQGTSYPIDIKALDINLDTGENSLSKLITNSNFKTTLRKADKSFIITNYFNDLKVTKVDDANNISSVVISKTKTNASFFKRISKSLFESIRTDEFVKNGSIKSYKVYCDNDDIIYLTKDDVSKRTTSLIRVNFNTTKVDESIIFKEFKYDQYQSVEEVASYFYGNKFYQLILEKNRGLVKAFDIGSNAIETLVFNNLNIPIKGKKFTDINSFIKEAIKGKYKSTMSINESIEGNLIMRFDYVDVVTYGYNYNWWWQHQQLQFMLDHQQSVINNRPSFGPSQFYSEFYFDDDEHYFEIVVDKDFNMIDVSETSPKLKYIDKQKHIKSVEDNELLKHISSVFLDDLFVYFYLDVETKLFKVSNKSIL